MAILNPERWTYELCALLPEDGKRHEVIDGEHCVTPSPNIRHQELVYRLAFELELAVREQSEGRVLGAPCDVYFEETNFVQPDVLYISSARSAIVTEANVQGAPDLVVEVLSESTRKRDETLKRELYGRFGVLEYWIVDPELETVKVYRLEEAAGFGDAELLVRARGDGLRTPLLPALLVPLEALFETA